MFFYLMFLTFTLEENWRSQNLPENWIPRKENLKTCTSFEEQKGTRYIRENVFLASAVFFLQNCFSDFF